MQRQQGLTFWSFVFTVVPIVLAALLTMLLFPAYSEFFSVKKGIKRIGDDPALNSMSDTDIRTMMSRTIDIDNIQTIKSKDLVIRRGERGNTTVSVEYEVVVPIVANVSALIEFSASTQNKNSD